MTLANRALDPEIDTLFLMASERYTHVSSTLIKQIAQLAVGSASGKLNEFVPPEVIEPLLKKYRRDDPSSLGLKAQKPPTPG